MSVWRETTLGQVCELKRGYDLPTASREPGEVPIVSSSGITGYHAVAKVSGPGVVTGRYGTLGEVYYVTGDFWPLNTSLYVRDFKGNEPRFVAALLKSLNLGRNESAAAVPGINRNHLHMLAVRCPDLATQRAVSHILASIDRLIENNAQRMTVLEELAKAIFREWFVEFRYPGHQRVPLVQSAEGISPQGWGVVAASDALHVGPSVRVSEGTQRRVFTMGDLSEEVSTCFPSATRTGNAGTKFQNGDTLFARITPCLENGKTGYVQGLAPDETALGSTEFIVLRGRKVGSSFTYLLARNEEFRRRAIQSMSGASGRQRVRVECFDSFMVAIPPPEIAAQFELAAGRFLALQFALASQAKLLAATRDLLLPRLVSGRLDISKLEWLEAS